MNRSIVRALRFRGVQFFKLVKNRYDQFKAAVFNHSTRVFISGIVIIALVLRAWNLGRRPMWTDEAVYAVMGQKIAKGALLPVWPLSERVFAGQPPLVIHLMSIPYHIVQSVPSAVHFRMVAVLAGVATVYVCYRIGASIYNEKVGLIAAFLIAVSPNHLLYSRQALPHSIGILAFVSVAYVLIKYCRHGEKKYIWATGAGSVLAISLHYLNVLLIPLVALTLIWRYISEIKKFRYRRRWAAWGAINIGSAAAYIIYFMNFTGGARTGRNPFRGEVSIQNPVTVVSALSEFLSRQIEWIVSLGIASYAAKGIDFLRYYGNLSNLFLPVFLAGVGVYFSATEKRGILWYPIALFASVFGVLIFIVYPFYQKIGISPVRSHSFLIPPMFILAAYGIEKLNGWKNLGYILLALFTVVSMLHFPLIATGNVVAVTTEGYHEFTVEIGKSIFNTVNTKLLIITGMRGLESRIRAQEYFKQTSSIVCSGEHYRPLFCFSRHPVGYNDAKNWQQPVNHILTQGKVPNKLVASMFVSHVAPVLYYLQRADPITRLRYGYDFSHQYRGNGNNSIQSLSCNIDKRQCNVTAWLRGEKSVWFVLDNVRSKYQLNQWETEYMKRRCKTKRFSYTEVIKCTGNRTE
ncbi:MAG: glycosyltransferase family 39 protein [Candidatus Nanohaloarchaea archaeon]|nr:glycosyltransferase family 39 protein [Candidatus Nanohaloarchaea archaeon]